MICSIRTLGITGIRGNGVVADAYIGSAQSAKCLPLWGRWHGEAVTDEVFPKIMLPFWKDM